MSKDDLLDALQAGLTLLPALALAIPGGLLHQVPTTVSAGIGWSTLLALPAIVLLAVRRRPAAFSGSTLLLAVLALASYGASTAGDPFEARRQVLVLGLGFALALSAASLGSMGRQVLLVGFTLLTLLLVAPTLHPQLGEHGALGNSGHTAQAALPGAVAGLALTLSGNPLLGALGAVAGVAFALYAGLVPVLAGLLGLAAAALAGLLCGHGRLETARLARITLVVTAVGAAALGARDLLASPDEAPARESVGGIEFRTRTWRAAATGLLPEHLLLGTGPGQFAREFPPHRDPVERELSSHRGLEPTPIEVEHVHNDWLQVVLDLGLIGGLPWVALLSAALVAAWGALRRGALTDAALGAAALASLAGALVHAPLLASPAAPAVLWPLLGAVLVRRTSAQARLATWLPALAGVLLLLRSDAAWRFVQHGSALASLAEAPRLEFEEVEGLRAADVAPHVAAALRACPDSVIALEKRDEVLRAIGAPNEERRDTLGRVLDARPHHLAALQNLGVVLAQEGRFELAEETLLRARELAPESRALRRNLFIVAFEGHDADLMLDLVLELLEDPTTDRSWLRSLASRLLLAGRPQDGAALLQLVEPDLDASSPDAAYQLSRKLKGEEDDRILADALTVRAHQGFARHHVALERYEDAVRSYRQAVQIARHYPDLPGGDTLLRLEFAAALVLSDREGDAEPEVERANPSMLQWSKLPPWAGQALLDAGLVR